MMGMLMAKAPQSQIDALWKFLEEIGNRAEKCAGTDRIGAYVQKNWGKVSAVWERILFGYQTLLQCTDPDKDYLDYRPDIKAALIAAGIEKEQPCSPT